MRATRASKLATLKALAEAQNRSLAEHPRADQHTAWRDFDLTVEEGLGELNRICAIELSVTGTDTILRLPEPSPAAKQLLEALQVNLPPVLPGSKVVADTKRKLQTRRKNV